MTVQELEKTVSTDIVKQANQLSIHTQYTSEYIQRFVENSGVDAEKALAAIELSETYSAKPHKVIKLMQAGWSIDETKEAIQALHQLNEGLPLWRVRDLVGFRDAYPTFGDHISYDALIFLDDISGGSRDIGMIENALETIEERLEKYDCNAGLGSVVHVMRKAYEQDPTCPPCVDGIIERVMLGRFFRGGDDY